MAGAILVVGSGQDRRHVKSHGLLPFDLLPDAIGSLESRVSLQPAFDRVGFVREVSLTPRRAPVGPDNSGALEIGRSAVFRLDDGEIAHVLIVRHRGAAVLPTSVLSRLNALYPHLLRAMRLSRHIADERARTVVQALEMANIPAAVVDRKVAVIAANGLLGSGSAGGRSHFDVLIDRLDKQMRAAILETIDGDSRRPSLTIPLPGNASQRPCLVRVLSSDRNNDPFDRAAVTIILTPVSPRRLPPPSILERLFALTPTEARIAHAIGTGIALADVARSAGTSSRTARNQLRAVFQKTGIHRQSDLVGLLGCLALGDADFEPVRERPPRTAASLKSQAAIN